LSSNNFQTSILNTASNNLKDNKKSLIDRFFNNEEISEDEKDILIKEGFNRLEKLKIADPPVSYDQVLHPVEPVIFDGKKEKLINDFKNNPDKHKLTIKDDFKKPGEMLPEYTGWIEPEPEKIIDKKLIKRIAEYEKIQPIPDKKYLSAAEIRNFLDVQEHLNNEKKSDNDNNPTGKNLHNHNLNIKQPLPIENKKNNNTKKETTSVENRQKLRPIDPKEILSKNNYKRLKKSISDENFYKNFDIDRLQPVEYENLDTLTLNSIQNIVPYNPTNPTNFHKSLKIRFDKALKKYKDKLPWINIYLKNTRKYNSLFNAYSVKMQFAINRNNKYQYYLEIKDTVEKKKYRKKHPSACLGYTYFAINNRSSKWFVKNFKIPFGISILEFQRVAKLGEIAGDWTVEKGKNFWIDDHWEPQETKFFLTPLETLIEKLTEDYPKDKKCDKFELLHLIAYRLIPRNHNSNNETRLDSIIRDKKFDKNHKRLHFDHRDEKYKTRDKSGKKWIVPSKVYTIPAPKKNQNMMAIVNKQYIVNDLPHMKYQQVFCNGSMNEGGALYGIFNRMPKGARHLFNKKCGRIETDIHSAYLNILYASETGRLIKFKPYILDYKNIYYNNYQKYIKTKNPQCKYSFNQWLKYYRPFLKEDSLATFGVDGKNKAISHIANSRHEIGLYKYEEESYQQQEKRWQKTLKDNNLPADLPKIDIPIRDELLVIEHSVPEILKYRYKNIQTMLINCLQRIMNPIFVKETIKRNNPDIAHDEIDSENDLTLDIEKAIINFSKSAGAKRQLEAMATYKGKAQLDKEYHNLKKYTPFRIKKNLKNKKRKHKQKYKFICKNQLQTVLTHEKNLAQKKQKLSLQQQKYYTLIYFLIKYNQVKKHDFIKNFNSKTYIKLNKNQNLNIHQKSLIKAISIKPYIYSHNYKNKLINFHYIKIPLTDQLDIIPCISSTEKFGNSTEIFLIRAPP